MACQHARAVRDLPGCLCLHVPLSCVPYESINIELPLIRLERHFDRAQPEVQSAGFATADAQGPKEVVDSWLACWSHVVVGLGCNPKAVLGVLQLAMFEAVVLSGF